MGLFKKTKIRAEPAQAQNDTAVDIQLLRALFGQDDITAKEAMNIPSLSGPVNLIADKVASIPIKLYQKHDDKIIEINDDRTRLLNDDTGDTLDGNQFKKAMIRDYFLGKGGFAYVNWNGLHIDSIHYVDESKISFQKNNDPIFKEYYFMIQGYRYSPFQFIRLLRNTKDGITGISVLEESRLLLSVAYDSLKYESNLVSTGGNKRGFLKSSRKLSEEALEQLRISFGNLYSNNKENVVVLNDGIDFKEASNTSVEMQLNENKKSNGNEVCKAIGVPSSIVSGGATENDDKNFIKYKLTSVLSDFEQAINRAMLLETEKKNMFFQFDISELTKGDIEKRYSAYSTAIEKGFMQPDEVRTKENLPKLGMNFIKLGLQDGLYDPESEIVYVLNTDKKVNLKNLKKGGHKDED